MCNVCIVDYGNPRCLGINARHGFGGDRMNQQALKEKDITKQIRSVLKTFGIFHWKVWQGLGSTPGVPDIVGILKDGRFLGIEVKTEKGRLSDHQIRFIKNIQDAGGIAFVARSLEDVIEGLGLQKRMLF